MTEELPRFHRIKASCCTAEILRFDLPSRAPVLLAEDAIRHGWELTRQGDWLCSTHRREQP